MTPEIKPTCTTCGGELIADTKNNTYKCSFCGVAYGYGLFDGTAAEKAAKALSIGEFNDADLYYTIVLSMDPTNITALRGRIFCAAKWKKTLDLKTAKGELTGVRANTVRSRCEEAMKKSSEENAKYFKLIKDFVDNSERYRAAKVKAGPILKREKFLLDRSIEVDDRVERMEENYERARSRNYTLTDFLLKSPAPSPTPNELKDAWDVSDIMHCAVADSGKESKKMQDQISALERRRNFYYEKIVDMEKQLFRK